MKYSLLALLISANCIGQDTAVIIPCRALYDDTKVMDSYGIASNTIDALSKTKPIFAVGKYPLKDPNYIQVVYDNKVGFVYYSMLDLSQGQFEKLLSDKGEDRVIRAEQMQPVLDSLAVGYMQKALKETIRRERQFNAAMKHFATVGAAIMLTNHIGENFSGFDVTIYNPTKKTIKYVWLTTNAINPVNDVEAVKTVQAVGPIAPSAKGEYSFETVYYSKVISTIRLTKTVVQYMDGTKKVITGDQLTSISSVTN